MEYKEIIAISGMSGLYQLLSSKADGGIVRSLEDKSTRFVSSRIHHFTPLESIEVFTTGDAATLADIFKAMQEKENTVAVPAKKIDDTQALREYFSSVYPHLDKDKVYMSDMKKMVKWYMILKANDLLQFEKEEENIEPEKESEDKKAVAEEKKKEVTTPAQEAEAKKKPATKAKTKKDAGADEEVASAKKAKSSKKKTEK